jgi:hypothetical protein
MFKQFEIILTSASLVFSAIFLVLIFLRIRNILIKKNRISVWDKRVGMLNRIAKLTMAIAIPYDRFSY